MARSPSGLLSNSSLVLILPSADHLTRSTLKLCARWTLFNTPLARVITLDDDKVGRLHGCVLCVSQDGTIAVVAVDGYELYVFHSHPDRLLLA